MKILKSYDANFVFLGSRKYVQGATIIDGLIDAINYWGLGPVEKIESNFHSLLDQQGRYDLVSAQNPNVLIEEGYVAIFRFLSPQGKYLVGLTPRSEAVTASIPYDEDRLIEFHKILGEKALVSLSIGAEKPIIDIIVALNKRLLLSILPTENYGQWFLGRLDLELSKIDLSEKKLLNVQVTNNMLGMHVKSSVKLENEEIGNIYFSRGRA